MPLVNVKLIEGVFSPQQKRQIVENLTEAIVAIEGGKHARRHLGRRRRGTER
jgi:phenylpyruvate tautomerase PptA (4-oxalocrotonate tautomerase family)